ncbi:porphobilinogen deaminase isoform X1 [Hydra vulgaris]|uniref:porphobilinogen deaminase isoform X1 n=1 Tax=Hydra vulgaris TaxID=6087 RepID=UPI001F5FC707|nr:porphobilinogen deaminase [Hydra vulgaris]
MSELLKRKIHETEDNDSSKKKYSLVTEKTSVVVGSRKSQLAVIQTKSIVAALCQKEKDVECIIETMDTLGDKILHIALPKIGEKSLFTKDLELALSEKRVDFLVHSLKDLPTTLPQGMAISTIYKRDDPRDCIIFHPKHNGKRLADLPENSIIGTSSLRRVAQLKRKYNKLTFQSVRGNLNTRLQKLEEESLYDAIVLAKAGVDRMGWTEKIGQILSEDECLYAIGQGAITVEVRNDDKYTISILAQLTDMETLLACVAERSFMRTLNGGCSTPIACHSQFSGNNYSLRGIVLNADGSRFLDSTVSTTLQVNILTDQNEPPSYTVSKSGVVINSLYINEFIKAEKCGEELAYCLKKLGADDVLKEVRSKLPNISNIHVPISSDYMKL